MRTPRGAFSGRTSASANGARCARTTAPTATRGSTLPHDHARSRAYRWGEDGIAGVSDLHQRLCLSLALWNGEDPILKERLFGLTGNEGNHGEDVKEYYFYLDNLPSHAYMKMLYKYPHRAFPYAQLVEENRRRTRTEPEYELLDTGIFDDDAYFDVEVEYAKGAPEDILCASASRIAEAEPHALHVLPTLWFRNDWSWKPGVQRPELKLDDRRAWGSAITSTSRKLGSTFRPNAKTSCSSRKTKRTTNGCSATPNRQPVGEGRHQRVSRERQRCGRQPRRFGTKVASRHRV